MTNAPLSDKSGSDSQRSSAAASTLVKVKVYDTKEAAGAEEADPISWSASWARSPCR